MNKELRLEIIKEAYYRIKEQRKPLTPECMEIIRMLRKENDMIQDTNPEPDVAVGYLFGVGQQDIEEEIQLCGTHYKAGDSDWDSDNGQYDFSSSSKNLIEYLN